MKKIRFFLYVLAAVFSIFAQDAIAANDLKSEAIKRLQNAIVKALPADSNIVRLAILDFEGDDGTVKNAATSAITEKTTFKVIERADLDKILSEQGLQLKDIMDEKTRIQHGKIKGVQGILFGKVLSMDKGLMSFNIKIHLKLDDVEKGEIVVSKDISASAVSPLRNYLILGALGIVAILIIVTMLRKRRVTVIEKTTKEDVQVRVDLTKEVGRAVASISEAKAKLMSQGRSEDAIILKDAERDMLLLKEHVDNAARGSADMRKLTEFKTALESDKEVRDSFNELTKSSDRLYDAVVAGNSGSLEKEVDILRRDIRRVLSEFQGRGL